MGLSAHWDQPVHPRLALQAFAKIGWADAVGDAPGRLPGLRWFETGSFMFGDPNELL